MHVLVIGAGVVGVAIADELATRGAGVSVLDMRSPGRGASQASAGTLVPYIEAHEDTPLLPLAARSLAMYDEFVERLASRTNLAIEYDRSGSLDVALTGDDTTRLRVSKAWLDARGVANEWLDGAALASFEPAVTPAAQGGLFVKSHGFVGVSSLVRALVESARLAGATFESPVEAAAVMPRHDGVDVRAGDRSYVADHVVIAAGSWSRRIRVAGVEGPPVRPIRGQLLHLRRPGPGRPSRIVWSSRCYTVPWSDGSLLVGATVEDVGFDERSTVEGVRDLTTAVAELLPAASAAAVEAVRVGLRPASPDGLPIIGPLARAPRVTVATGHYRNGVLLAPLTAKLVADALVDNVVDPALSSTSPDRFASRA
ncbi:MAG: glycine oxidase ThiO [Vicinamibacterales bacterium]